MGYETRLYFVERMKAVYGDDGTDYGSVIAMIDLRKAGDPRENGLVPLVKPAIHIYADDGNTRITHDMHGDPLSVGDPADVLAALKKKTRGKEKYRRYVAAIALLDAMLEGGYDNLTVLGFGY